MSSPKICDFCGEFEHDCNCQAAKRIRQLEKELAEAKSKHLNVIHDGVRSDHMGKHCSQLLEELISEKGQLQQSLTSYHSYQTIAAEQNEALKHVCKAHNHSCEQTRHSFSRYAELTK